MRLTRPDYWAKDYRVAFDRLSPARSGPHRPRHGDGARPRRARGDRAGRRRLDPAGAVRRPDHLDRSHERLLATADAAVGRGGQRRPPRGARDARVSRLGDRGRRWGRGGGQRGEPGLDVAREEGRPVLSRRTRRAQAPRPGLGTGTASSHRPRVSSSIPATAPSCPTDSLVTRSPTSRCAGAPAKSQRPPTRCSGPSAGCIRTPPGCHRSCWTTAASCASPRSCVSPTIPASSRSVTSRRPTRCARPPETGPTDCWPATSGPISQASRSGPFIRPDGGGAQCWACSTTAWRCSPRPATRFGSRHGRSTDSSEASS